MSWSTSWGLYGNADTSISNFLGTTDARPLVIKTSNRVAVRVSAGGDVSVGIPGGTRSPQYKLDIGGLLNADDVYRDGAPLVGSQWETVEAGISYKAGNVGIGTANPQAKLQVSGGAIMPAVGNSPTAGIQFPSDPGGGAHDQAFIRYYVESGETTKLLIGCHNDADDRIGFYQFGGERLTIYNGNVGVGTTSPATKLHVAGGLWNPSDTEGDFKIGDATYRLKIGVATGGGGAGDARIRAHGGTNRLMLGSGTLDTLFLVGDRVGVGTMHPGARLDISGSGGATQCCAPVVPTLSLAEASNTANRQAWIQFHNAGEAEAYIRLSGGGAGGSGREGQRRIEIGDNQGASTALQVLANSNPLRFTASWNGFPDAVTNQAEISNDTGSYKTLMIVGNRAAGLAGPGLGRRVSVWDVLDVNGNLNVTVNAFKPSGPYWSHLSDARLKRGVRPLKGALDKLSRLRGVSFEWKEHAARVGLTGRQIGLIAQEVEKVLPEWIDIDSNGYKNLTIKGFEALVVEAFKELKARNDKLRSRIETLERANQGVRGE